MFRRIFLQILIAILISSSAFATEEQTPTLKVATGDTTTVFFLPQNEAQMKAAVNAIETYLNKSTEASIHIFSGSRNLSSKIKPLNAVASKSLSDFKPPRTIASTIEVASPGTLPTPSLLKNLALRFASKTKSSPVYHAETPVGDYISSLSAKPENSFSLAEPEAKKSFVDYFKNGPISQCHLR